MTVADIPAVMVLEEENPAPWTVAQMFGHLQLQHGWQYVARHPDTHEILGFACGQTVADEAELFRLAVHEKLRRQGIASALLDHITESLGQTGVSRLFLEVRSANLAARRLYEKQGFSHSGTRPNYYRNPADHAVTMTKKLS